MTSANITQNTNDFLILLKTKKKFWSGVSTATISLDQKVTKSELLFAGFLVEHNLPITTANRACILLCAIFPDLELLTKLVGQRLLTC